jgi:hypothetical protein
MIQERGNCIYAYLSLDLELFFFLLDSLIFSESSLFVFSLIDVLKA